MSDTRPQPAWLRPALDYGPLAVFFGVYVASGLMTATAALMAATGAALVLALAVQGRVPVMPLITAAVVGIFGGLTLWLNDATFIKMKPTIIEVLFAAVLLGGLVVDRPLLRLVLGHAFPPLPDAVWRRLTLRFAVFFLALAGLNELVWRTMPTDYWVVFKVFGFFLLTFLFMIAQMPLVWRNRLGDEPGGTV